MNHHSRDELQATAFLAVGAAQHPKTLRLAEKYHFDGRAGLIGEALPAAARSVEHAYRMLDPDLRLDATWVWFTDVVEPLGAWLAREWAAGRTPGHDELVEQVFVRVNALEDDAA